MAITTDAVARWPVLAVCFPFVIAGLAMIWRPAVFAQLQSDFYRKRYGIVAGPVGAGTKLFYRAQGTFIVGIGIAVSTNVMFQ